MRERKSVTGKQRGPADDEKRKLFEIPQFFAEESIASKMPLFRRKQEI